MKESLGGRILLLDINAPWVHSLISAVVCVTGARLQVHASRVLTFWHWFSSVRSRTRLGRPEEVPGLSPPLTLVPGWTRFERLSTGLVKRWVTTTIGHLGSPKMIMYTLPQYARVAESFSQWHRQVYYAYDAYRFYSGWNAVRIDSLEHQMLNACSLAFGVSRDLVHDLQRKSPIPVHYSPNAVSSGFLAAVANGKWAVPEDLASMEGKIAGCIGQLHADAYDWRLIESLSARYPLVSFILIGNVMRSTSLNQLRMDHVLRLPNVHWLGPKPHSQLPAYLNRFDVCLNFLAATEQNHRRSPLRLYDYLATTKPIISTAIREAYEHAQYIEIAVNEEQFAQKLGRALAHPHLANLQARRSHVLRNTWEARAATFCTALGWQQA